MGLMQALRGSLPWYSLFHTIIEVAAKGAIFYIQILLSPASIPDSLCVPGTTSPLSRFSTLFFISKNKFRFILGSLVHGPESFGKCPQPSALFISVLASQ